MLNKRRNLFIINDKSRSQKGSKEHTGQNLVRMYDLAIELAQQENSKGVRNCLRQLRHTLDPSSQPEVVLNQSQLYLDCKQTLDQRDFAGLMKILEHVKRHWIARIQVDSALKD